jgi:gliding motility-associated-like protein
MKKIILMCFVFVAIVSACRKTHVSNDICDCANSQSTFYIGSDTLIVPNLFTPNGDGQNDEWFITNLDKFPGIKIKVSRPGLFGGTVYNYTSDNPYWNGDKGKNNLYKEGKYKYEITVNGQTLTGYICIFRGKVNIDNHDCLKACKVIDQNDPVIN